MAPANVRSVSRTASIVPCVHEEGAWYVKRGMSVIVSTLKLSEWRAKLWQV